MDLRSAELQTYAPEYALAIMAIGVALVLPTLYRAWRPSAPAAPEGTSSCVCRSNLYCRAATATLPPSFTSVTVIPYLMAASSCIHLVTTPIALPGLLIVRAARLAYTIALSKTRPVRVCVCVCVCVCRVSVGCVVGLKAKTPYM